MINFLILRYYGASDVTSYNIAYKYFSILTMIWGILTTPLWVAVTDAISKHDFAWIRNAQKKYLIVIMFGSIFVMIINGSGELKVQTYASLISPFVFTGISMLLINNGMGIEAILISSIISNFNGLILAPIQCHQMLKKHE